MELPSTISKWAIVFLILWILRSASAKGIVLSATSNQHRKLTYTSSTRWRNLLWLEQNPETPDSPCHRPFQGPISAPSLAFSSTYIFQTFIGHWPPSSIKNEAISQLPQFTFWNEKNKRTLVSCRTWISQWMWEKHETAIQVKCLHASLWNIWSAKDLFHISMVWSSYTISTQTTDYSPFFKWNVQYICLLILVFTVLCQNTK